MKTAITCPSCGDDIQDLLEAVVADFATEEAGSDVDAAGIVKAARKVAKYKTQRNELRTQLAEATAQLAALRAENTALRGQTAAGAASAAPASTEEARELALHEERLARLISGTQFSHFPLGILARGPARGSAAANEELRQELGVVARPAAKAPRRELSEAQAAAQRSLGRMLNTEY